MYYLLFYLFSLCGKFPLQSYWSLSCDHGLHCRDELIENNKNNKNNNNNFGAPLEWPLDHVFLETLAIDKVSVSDSTVILSTEPIWGTAFAAVLLGGTIRW